jgi:hypothetical protein
MGVGTGAGGTGVDEVVGDAVGGAVGTVPEVASASAGAAVCVDGASGAIGGSGVIGGSGGIGGIDGGGGGVGDAADCVSVSVTGARPSNVAVEPFNPVVESREDFEPADFFFSLLLAGSP